LNADDSGIVGVGRRVVEVIGLGLDLEFLPALTDREDTFESHSRYLLAMNLCLQDPVTTA
jgi:hypothetical protein